MVWSAKKFLLSGNNPRFVYLMRLTRRLGQKCQIVLPDKKGKITLWSIRFSWLFGTKIV